MDRPRFSPNGEMIAYRAQKRPGFEADRWELIVAMTDAGGSSLFKPVSLTEQF